MNHAQVYKDHCYLWSIGEAHDMTGSYVDQEDLSKLLKNPTKGVATECLCCQIEYWFSVGPDIGMSNRCSGEDSKKYIETDSLVREIAKRHGVI